MRPAAAVRVTHTHPAHGRWRSCEDLRSASHDDVRTGSHRIVWARPARCRRIRGPSCRSPVRWQRPKTLATPRQVYAPPTRRSRRRHRHQRRHHSNCMATTHCTRRMVYRAHTSTTAWPAGGFGAPAVRKHASLSRGSLCSASPPAPHHPASRRRPDRLPPARTLPTQGSSRSRRRRLKQPPTPSRTSWARLFARVFSAGLSTCPLCAGPMEVLDAVVGPLRIAQILTSDAGDVPSADSSRLRYSGTTEADDATNFSGRTSRGPPPVGQLKLFN